MQNRIDSLKDHFIVGGIGRVGDNVTEELIATGRPYVVIDVDTEKIAAHQEKRPEALCLHGDAGEDELLLRAGLARARGVFAITGDDSKNLVIALSAKQLNPAVRVVARCHDVNFVEKIRRVGADDIVSPDFTGGMRIASSMLRPAVVSFLDEMLRTDEKLRVEEIVMPANALPRLLSELAPPSREYIVLAIRESGGWQFNPSGDHTVVPGTTLVAMASPARRRQLEKALGAS